MSAASLGAISVVLCCPRAESAALAVQLGLLVLLLWKTQERTPEAVVAVRAAVSYIDTVDLANQLAALAPPVSGAPRLTLLASYRY